MAGRETIPDLYGPAFLRIEADGTSEMAFALAGAVAAGFPASGIDVDWNGSDEGDQVQGTDQADLCDDGRLGVEIAYGDGDQTIFIADRQPFQ